MVLKEGNPILETHVSLTGLEHWKMLGGYRGLFGLLMVFSVRSMDEYIKLKLVLGT